VLYVMLSVPSDVLDVLATKLHNQAYKLNNELP